MITCLLVAWRTELPSKYGNKKTEVDGYKFDSLAEAAHYRYVLKPRLLSGEISHLEVHPRYEIVIDGKKICRYEADFRYIDHKLIGKEGQIGCRVVEDVKGYKTAVYKLKKKLVEAMYPGTTIVEISPGRSRPR